MGKEICICAAMRFSDGTIYRGHRHGDCFWTASKAGANIKAGTHEQGFMTSANRFVSRKKGGKLQEAAGIPSAAPEGYRGDTLFSEDLY